MRNCALNRPAFVWAACAAALVLELASLPLRAQVYSPRRLTQRIAPSLPPANSAARGSVPAPGVSTTVPVDPEQQAADRAEAARKTEEFRNQHAQDDAKATDQTNSIPTVPLLIQCNKLETDPGQSLQFLSLSLSNAAPVAIRRVTMHLIYYGDNIAKPQEWTTRRELDRPLPAGRALELDQPAYYMPWTTKRVKVEVKEVEFSDGKTWAPPASPP